MRSIKAGVFVGTILALAAAPAFAGNLYNDIPNTDINGGPENTSQAAYATGTSSFGDLIEVGAGVASTATVMMSNYAVAADYGTDAASYNAALTLNLYQVTSTNQALDTVGGTSPDAVATSSTLVYTSGEVNQAIAYQSASNPAVGSTLNCGTDNGVALTPQAGLNGQGNTVAACGTLNAVTFNLSNLNLAAGAYVYTVALDLDNSSAAAQSLNWALNNGALDPTSISVASNPAYDIAYLNGIPVSGYAGLGQGELALNTSSGTPEPATLGLIGLGLLGIGGAIRKKSRKI
jgi:hypothetical protein